MYNVSFLFVYSFILTVLLRIVRKETCQNKINSFEFFKQLLLPSPIIVRRVLTSLYYNLFYIILLRVLFIYRRELKMKERK